MSANGWWSGEKIHLLFPTEWYVVVWCWGKSKRSSPRRTGSRQSWHSQWRPWPWKMFQLRWRQPFPPLKGSFTWKWNLCHHFLILMSFQTCVAWRTRTLDTVVCTKTTETFFKMSFLFHKKINDCRFWTTWGKLWQMMTFFGDLSL